MSSPMTNTLHQGRGDFAILSRMKILVIDDEATNVALLEEMLAEAGYTRVKSVVESARALETCAEFDPDLVLLDLMMPPPDGFAILESLRAANGEIFLPIIVLTADITERAKRRALAGGATDFLVKPFDHLEVLLRIGNALGTRRLHLLLDNQRAAFEEAVRTRSLELREAQSHWLGAEE